MKSLVKTLVLAGAAAASFGVSAKAADDIDVLTAPVETLVEFGSGWYLRGDVSVTANAGRIIETYSDGTTETDTEFRDMLGFDVGFGYRLNNNVRLDIGVGHHLSGENASYRQLTEAEKGTDPTVTTDTTFTNPYTETAEGRCGGWALDGDGDPFAKYIENCSTFDEATYDTFTLMGTGYFDLGKIGGFEPYVGAGLGLARVRWEETVDGTICTPKSADTNLTEGCNGQSGTDQPGPNDPYKYGGVKSSGTDYRLAYSLNAGFAYRIKENLLLDASYRYLAVGDTMGIATGSSKAQSTAKEGFGLHQVKFGLRYEIW